MKLGKGRSDAFRITVPFHFYIAANNTSLVLLPASFPSSSPPSFPSQMEPPTRIRRTIRACLQCRTRKQRCDGPYTVPCQRCKSAGRECSFETEAVPESPRFHPYSGDRNFSPHALLDVQREYVQTLQLFFSLPLSDRNFSISGSQKPRGDSKLWKQSWALPQKRPPNLRTTCLPPKPYP